MKTPSHFRLHAIELLVVILLLSANGVSQAQNLLTDPGFESGTFSPSGWSPINAAALSHDYTHSGQWSLKDAYDISGGGPVVAGTQILPATPGSIFMLTGWALTPMTLTNSQGLLLVDFLDSSQHLINYNNTVFYDIGAIDGSTPKQTWTFLSGSVTAPPGTASIQVLAELFNGNNPSPFNVVYFDDLTLTQVPEPAAETFFAICVGAFLLWRKAPSPTAPSGRLESSVCSR